MLSNNNCFYSDNQLITGLEKVTRQMERERDMNKAPVLRTVALKMNVSFNPGPWETVPG